MFYYSKRDDLAIAQIPKAGLMSFNEWLRYPVVGNAVARRASIRVAFFRHPLERLKSAYSMWFYQGKASLPDWHGFVDRVLDGWVDEHWKAQVLHVEDVPNVYHKFENIQDHWEGYKRGCLPRENHWSRVPEIDDYREGELLILYAEDLRIWETADGL
jgi:hypothetical protein